MTFIYSWKTPIYLFVQLTLVLILICPSPTPAKAENRKPKLSLSGDLYFVNNMKEDIWTKIRSKEVHLVGDVQQYLAKLNEGEFSDWRLPTKQELYDLFMIFDMKNNGDVKIRIEGRYWMVNDTGTVIAGAWEIGSGCGPERIFYPGKKGHIMAVRP